MKFLAPKNSAGFQVRRCHLKFDRVLNARLAPHALKPGYWYYLRALWIADGITQRELSDVANVTETTMVTVLNSMAANGLVTRERDKTDKRKVRVKLTDYGRQLEHELIDIAIDVNHVATAGISRADIATCLSVLDRMSQNLVEELEHVAAP